MLQFPGNSAQLIPDELRVYPLPRQESLAVLTGRHVLNYEPHLTQAHPSYNDHAADRHNVSCGAADRIPAYPPAGPDLARILDVRACEPRNVSVPIVVNFC